MKKLTFLAVLIANLFVNQPQADTVFDATTGELMIDGKSTCAVYDVDNQSLRVAKVQVISNKHGVNHKWVNVFEKVNDMEHIYGINCNASKFGPPTVDGCQN